jgi:hypothetical protein
MNPIPHHRCHQAACRTGSPNPNDLPKPERPPQTQTTSPTQTSSPLRTSSASQTNSPSRMTSANHRHPTVAVVNQSYLDRLYKALSSPFASHHGTPAWQTEARVPDRGSSSGVWRLWRPQISDNGLQEGVQIRYQECPSARYEGTSW